MRGRFDGLEQRINDEFKAVHTLIATLGKAVETIANGQQKLSDLLRGPSSSLNENGVEYDASAPAPAEHSDGG